MRVCFICIGYEPGRDGVGDYVRGLIGRLPTHFAAQVVALADPFAADAAPGDRDVVRIPARLPAAERYRRAAAALAAFNPDVISLQFVTWAFGPKGVVLGEAERLRALVGGRPLHVMFHEPWVRSGHGDRLVRRLRSALLGRAQRASIRRLAAMLRPAASRTSNREYQAMFARAGMPTGILPIFGSIAPVAGDGWNAVRALARAGGHDDPGLRARWLVAGLFGAIRDRWDARPLLRRLSAIAKGEGKRLLLVSVGHDTPLGEDLVRGWAAALPGMTALPLGVQPADAISQILASLDVGLAHQPAAALGRSTTTAAMLEHGRPVIPAPGGALDHDDPFVRRWRALLVEDGPALEADLARARRAAPPRVDLRAETAAQLVAELEAIAA